MKEKYESPPFQHSCTNHTLGGGSFDRGDMGGFGGEGFDLSTLPEGFDPSQIPGGGGGTYPGNGEGFMPGQGQNGSQSSDSSGNNRPSSGSFPSGGSFGGSGSCISMISGDASTVILLAVSFIVLAVGIIIAKVYKY